MDPIANFALRLLRQEGMQLAQALSRMRNVHLNLPKEQAFFAELQRSLSRSLTWKIQKAYPEHAVHDNHPRPNPRMQWVILPMAAPTQYLHLRKSCLIAVALYQKNQISALFAHDIFSDSDYLCQYGQGGQKNGQRLRLSNRIQHDLYGISMTEQDDVNMTSIWTQLSHVAPQLHLTNTQIIFDPLVAAFEAVEGQLSLMLALGPISELMQDILQLLAQDCGASYRSFAPDNQESDSPIHALGYPKSIKQLAPAAGLAKESVAG